MTNDVRILIVDDHALLRKTLAEQLDRESDFCVVGTASSAAEAIEKAIECRPNLVLMDIDMPGLGCFDAAERIMAMWADTKLIFLSAFFQDRYVEEALRVGARGYLTKRESPTALVEAIREVANGGVCFSEEVRSRLAIDDGGTRLKEVSKSLASTLTTRETETLRYVAKGLAKKEIAQTMGISVKTVDRHVSNLMAKLDIHDRVQLARYAIREGLIQA